MLIHIIEDDQIFAEILGRYCYPHQVEIFHDTVSAIQALDDDVPNLIFLDILLDGPDGFTYLNEIVSYADTCLVPVVLISSLYRALPPLLDYNVVAYLDKTNFTPHDVEVILRHQEALL